MKNKLILWAVLFLVGFVTGFVPQFISRGRLETELVRARADNDSYRDLMQLSELRDLISLTYLEATKLNFGIARKHSSLFFDQLRDAANQTVDPGAKQGLEGLLNSRDAITAGLAKGEETVIGQLQDLLTQTFQITKKPER